MITVDISGFGSLRLTEKSRALLRGDETIALRKDPEVVSKKSKSSAKRDKKLNVTDDSLWQVLKAKRLELAHEQGVPPYVIFHDSTLIEMQNLRPKTLDEFATISGVGQRKLERYGEIFIQAIAETVSS